MWATYIPPGMVKEKRVGYWPGFKKWKILNGPATLFDTKYQAQDALDDMARVNKWKVHRYQCACQLEI